VRWLADECIAAALVARLRNVGDDVIYMAEEAAGSSDANVIKRAQAESRLLLTEDKGFGELIFRSEMPVPGLVLLRIDPEKHAVKWDRLEAAIARYQEGLIGRYLVIEETRFRSRPLLRSV
jgi:predicted nuclease of predicted toxin-antitoxin system